MKKLAKPNTTLNADSIQEKITNLSDDLLTVLEGHMDELDNEVIFYHAFKFMTIALYECFESHQEALKVLRMGMDHGIQAAMEKRGK